MIILDTNVVSELMRTPAVGCRRQVLEAAALKLFDLSFAQGMLDFDGAAAMRYADLVATRRRQGRPMASFDLMTAAIALAHGASVATRNIADFEGCGVTLHDPWSDD